MIIKGHRVGDADREAEILEVRGENGGPPYVVRRFEDGHVSLFFPSVDAAILQKPPMGVPRKDEGPFPSVILVAHNPREQANWWGR